MSRVFLTIKQKIQSMEIIISNKELSWAPQTKYVSVDLDNRLTFRILIENIDNKTISWKILTLPTRNYNIPQGWKLQYTYLVRPIIIYVDSVRCNVAQSHCNELQKSQNSPIHLHLHPTPNYRHIAQLVNFRTKLISNPHQNPTFDTLPKLLVLEGNELSELPKSANFMGLEEFHATTER